MTCFDGSKQELHLGIRFISVRNCHPVCSHLLYSGKKMAVYIMFLNKCWKIMLNSDIANCS